MKKLISILQIYALVAAMCSPALAGTATIVKADSYEGGPNTLINPDGARSTAGYSASGGTFTTGASGNATYFSWDSSAAGQTVLSGYQTVSSGDPWSGANGVISARFKCASGTCTHKLQVYDGTNILNEKIITSSTTSFVPTTVNFIYPASGVVGWRLISVASDEPIVYWRNGIRGLADGYNLSQVSQAQFIGSAYFATTASCAWSRTNTAIGSFSTTAACPGPTVEFNPGPGVIQTTDTDLPKVTVTNLAPGYCKATFQHRIDTSSTGVLDFRISDGTTTSGGAGSSPNTTTAGAQTTVGWFNYTTAGDRTFELQASASSGSVTVNNQSGNNRTWFSLECYPAQSINGFRADQTPASWSGYQNGWTGSSTVCSTGSTTYADTSACTGITLNTLTNRNIACTQTSGSLPGIDCVLPRSGTYHVCAQYQQTPYTGTQRIAARLMAGSTIMNPGMEINPSAASMFFPTPICGKYVASASGTTTFKLQLANSSNQTGLVVPLTAGSAGIMWTVDEGDAPQAAPYFMNSVTSNTSGQEHFERISFSGNSTMSANCTASPCTIATQSGSWATQVARSTTGTYVITVPTGEWSATPVCVPSGDGNVSNPTCNMGYSSSTSTSITIYSKSPAGALVDGGCHLLCMGPR